MCSSDLYLFMPFETGQAGVMRFDRATGTAVTIVNPGTQAFVSGDASRWTPWGTYLTCEENWHTAFLHSRGSPAPNLRRHLAPL